MAFRPQQLLAWTKTYSVWCLPAKIALLELRGVSKVVVKSSYKSVHRALFTFGWVCGLFYMYGACLFQVIKKACMIDVEHSA